jgi:hypothetical protein
VLDLINLIGRCHTSLQRRNWLTTKLDHAICGARTEAAVRLFSLRLNAILLFEAILAFRRGTICW